ncbi:MAG: DUF6607 family protein [Flavobacteriaceae bacterium]
MNKAFLLGIFSLLIGFTIKAQTKKEKDIEAIKKMCGCFEVTFNFAETFNYSNDSSYIPSETKIDKGLEYTFLIEDEDNTLSIQHLLLVGNPTDPHIVKHWRQDWIYENTDFYMFNHDNQWTYVKKPKNEVLGQWTQKVYQVDDSPRYEGSSSWVHVDGKSYWENTSTAPLPRREYTKRNDYNVTLRGNRHEITSFGWIHDQDNEKVIRTHGKEDFILAKEKGLNSYVKVDDSRCKAGANWWEKNAEKWSTVRKKWNKVFAKNENLELKEKVNNEGLFKQLSATEVTSSEQIEGVIDAFVVQE